MSVYMPGPQWGEVLQQPNTALDQGGADRARALWMARQGEMSTAQQAALDQLTKALTSGRDASMAAQAAKDAALLAASRGRGGGGGGGRKGGGGKGGSTGMMVPAPTVEQPGWVDQYIAGMPAAGAPPTYNPNPNWWDVTGQAAWQMPPKPLVPTVTPTPVGGTGTTSYDSRAYSVAHPLGVGVLPRQPVQPQPTRYASRLS